MRGIRKIALLGGTAVVMTLAGCEGTTQMAQMENKATTAKVDASLARFGGRDAVRAGGAQLSEGVFVAATPERANAGVMLPTKFEAAGAVVLESSQELSLGEIAARLSEITRLPHLVALGPTGQLASSPMSGAAADDLKVKVHLRGPLSEVLNEIAATFEVEWSYVGGRVVFQDFVTRQYQISALPSSSTASSEIGSNGLSASSALASDLWKEISDALGGMASEGAKVAIGSSTGLVTVTAKVSDHNRIAEYVDELNANIGQQITFDVNVLSVTLDNEESLGVDLNAAFARAGSTMTDSRQASFGAGVLNIGVVEGDFNLGAVVSALSSQGQASVTTRTAATTSNNRMAPLEIVETTTYLREVSSDTDDNGNVSYTRVPGEVTTGFQMQLFPRVLNNREMMVQYSVQLSALNQLKSFGEGDNAIQLPETSTTSFEQQAVLKNGETLILAGFERQRTDTTDTSLGRVGKLPIGGAETAKMERVATVMLITPRLIDRRSAIGDGR